MMIMERRLQLTMVIMMLHSMAPPTMPTHRMELTMVPTTLIPVHMEANMPHMQPTIPTITVIIFHTILTIMAIMDMDYTMVMVIMD